jgi:hypothetical protein
MGTKKTSTSRDRSVEEVNVSYKSARARPVEGSSMRTIRVVSSLAALLIVSAISLPAEGFPANFKTKRMSVKSNGGQGDDDSWQAEVSANGRFVAFTSDATDLVPQDENEYPDVFLHNKKTGSTRRMSVDSSGGEADEGSPASGDYALAMSSDGRFVAFESGAGDLVNSDDGSSYDIFVHNRKTGTTRRVSVGMNGAEPDGDSYLNVDISADGEFIAFQSDAANLVPNDNNTKSDVFVANRITGKIRRVSVDSNGNEADGGADPISGRFTVAISPNGRYVVFDSLADDLVPNDDNEMSDIFLHDRRTGRTRRVSVANNEDEGDGHSRANADVSANGNLVAFSSLATNLVPADDNPGFSDVFVRNIDAGTTRRVSVRSNGTEGNADSGQGATGYYDTMLRITPSGRFVAFVSAASNLVPEDNLGRWDVFVHNRRTGKTRRVSVKTNGDESNGMNGQYGIAMTPDARFVAYFSAATNLDPPDAGADDIFLSGPLRS